MIPPFPAENIFCVRNSQFAVHGEDSILFLHKMQGGSAKKTAALPGKRQGGGVPRGGVRNTLADVLHGKNGFPVPLFARLSLRIGGKICEFVMWKL